MSNVDDSLLCPITLELFKDPVLAQDGHTYEREAIVDWIRRKGRSPLTDQLLSLEHLYPNHAIKKAVDRFENSLKRKRYQYILDVDYAEWLATNQSRPEIILLKIDGARSKKEASFYVELSRHPHIVRTYGLVHEENDEAEQNDENAVMLLQEHAPMGSLYDVLQERRKAPDEKFLIEIFLQILDAMTFLAFNNIVHADLACRNVLVFRFDEKDPKKTVVKITDFGLSRHSRLYSLAPSAKKTILNIIPTRYVAPEILSSNTTPDDYTEKSDIYSMGILMWEAYSKCAIPWAKIDDDSEVARRVINGERLSKPLNCSDSYWSIICRTWSHLPKDRPTFAELKRLFTQQYYETLPESLNAVPLTTPMSTSSEEFKSIEQQFLNGWPSQHRHEIRVDQIHKIKNPLLESRYQQFVRSNPKFVTQECIGWHGTAAKCHDGKCMSYGCSLCQIIRNGFDKNCARKKTISYRCWSTATYFANKSFVCHTFNGASQLDDTTLRRCTLMVKINHGRRLPYERIEGNCSTYPHLIQRLLNRYSWDSIRFNRNYYIAPAEYILLYNNLASLPLYIIVYSYKTKTLLIRENLGEYCSFHHEYHICQGGCDGHGQQSCLGGAFSRNYTHNGTYSLVGELADKNSRWLPPDDVLRALGDSIDP